MQNEKEKNTIGVEKEVAYTFQKHISWKLFGHLTIIEPSGTMEIVHA
jgi:hypothetical protein